MFNLFKYLFTDLAVDLGTANTIVFAQNKGYVINQPSVIAYNALSSGVIAIGYEAKEMLGKTGEMIRVVRPLSDGVISDFLASEEMIRTFIKNAAIHKYRIGKVIMGVPTGITEVEKRAVIEATEQTGAREVYLIAEPMAAAIGTGLDVLGKEAHMIIDIGGGTTDIAVINYGGIVVDNTIRIAGDEMNEAIIRFMKLKYHLNVGESSAEKMKIEFGTISDRFNGQFLMAKGFDYHSGLPCQLKLSNGVFIEALNDVVGIIVSSILDTLEKLPADLIADIIEKGIILTGGGALLRGLDDVIRERTQLPVSIADDPMYSVAEGARIVLDDLHKYRSVLMKH
jgi:rod shape-determining protein MreB